MQILGSLEDRSEHPLAQAVVEKAKRENVTFSLVADFKIIEGKGLTGTIENIKYYAGNLKLLQDLNIDFDKKQIETVTEQGKTPVLLTSEKEVLAIIGIADTLKDNAVETIKELHKLGLKIVLLTGDNEKTARHIAQKVGIDEVIAEVLPNQKAEKIKELQKQGRVVAMGTVLMTRRHWLKPMLELLWQPELMWQLSQHN